MKTLFMLLTIGMLAVAVMASYSCINTQLEVGKDIGAPLNRAQVAANPTDMDKFMAKVQEGMEKHGMTSGNWGIINQTDDSDFAVAYEAVKSIRVRIATIKGFDPNSTQYQVGLDDVRGTIRELNIGQQDQVQKEHLWVPILWVLGIGAGVVWLGYNWGDYPYRRWRWSV